jgi:PAS domain S-box-containing protein
VSAKRGGRKTAAGGRAGRAPSLERLLALSHDLLCVIGPDGLFRRVSAAGVRLLGWTEPELLARPYLEVVHPDDRESTLAELSSLAVGAPPTRFRNRCLTRDGGSRRLVWTWSASEDGLVYAVARDVTDRVRERERRAALLRVTRRFLGEADPERVLDALLEEAQASLEVDAAAVFRWDDVRRALVVCRSAGLDRPVPPLEAGAGAIGRAIAERTPVVVSDYQHSPEQVPWIAETGVQAAAVVPIADGTRRLGALWVATRWPGGGFGHEEVEVLELLAGLAAASLVALERARLEGVLLAARTAQHEGNNLLSLTVGYTEILAHDPDLPPHLREMAVEAHDGAHAAAAVLQRLREIIRIREAGPGPADLATIDLAASTAASEPAR